MSENNSSFELTPARRRLLEALLDQADLDDADLPDISTSPGLAGLVSSFAQERMWLLDQIETLGSTYNIWHFFRLTGPLDPNLLADSLNQVVQRHAVLRTTYHLAGEQVVQIVDADQVIPLERFDFTAVLPAEREAAARQSAQEFIHTPFDLRLGPLARCCLVDLGDENWLFLLVVHHIAYDDWSRGIFLGELYQFYQAGLQGRQPELLPLPIQYVDFSAWQRRTFAEGKFAGDLNYWRTKLADASQVIDLPFDYPRPAKQTFNGGKVTRLLPAADQQVLRKFSQAERVTMFTACLAVFGALLHGYTHQDDLLIGTPIANRPRLETQGLIGFFLNTLVLRSQLSQGKTFRQYLHIFKETVLEAFDHQNYPFEKLVDELKPRRDLSRNPFFQVMFVFLHRTDPKFMLPGIETQGLNVDTGTAKFDLTLFVYDRDEGLETKLEYNSDLFKLEKMEQFLENFQSFLAAVLANPDQVLEKISILTESQLNQLRSWNNTTAEFPATVMLHQFFERQAALTPDATAVEAASALPDRDRVVSYGELNQMSNWLAAWLQQHGVGPDILVGICGERTVELIAALLAVMKAGGTCLPLDPAYPKARLELIIQQSQPAVVLLDSQFKGLVPISASQVFYLDRDWPGLEAEPVADLAAQARPDNLLYVLYTSGSTGLPKGVAMAHQPLVNLLAWQQRQTGLDQPARTLQFTSLNFDVAYQEIFTTFAAGGALVLVDEQTRRDSQALLAWLAERAVERLFLPFVALQSLAETASRAGSEQVMVKLAGSLRQVVTAGEQLQITPQLVDFFARLPECSLHNHYGPTETHVVSAFTLYRPPLGALPADWPKLPPIGRPISNVQIFVLNSQKELTPPGIPGEIYIAGSCLARGYYQREDLTDERFLTLDVNAEGPQRMYRTGDQGLWREDGQLVYLGRMDDQVKIRGYRVEPAEIEVVLSRYPQVRQAVVIARAGPTGDRRLTAYLVCDPAPDVNNPGEIARLTTAIKAFLASHLPEYMIPADCVFLENLPMTPNGKVDRLSLPEPGSSVPGRENALPQDALEAQIAAVWSDVLKIHPVDVTASFFDLGGQSLLAVRLFAEIHDRLDISLPISSLFQHPSVRDMAEYARLHALNEPWSSLILIQAGKERRPFFCVHGFGGGVLGYADLAGLLGADQPFFGLQAAGFDGSEILDKDITQMAARYIQMIKSIQPEGPYLLGGYCFGGVVAYEMACQLEQAGEQARLVAIMEGYAPRRFLTSEKASVRRRLAVFQKNLPYWFKDYRDLGLHGIKVRLWQTGQKIKRRLNRWIGQEIENQPQEVVMEDLAAIPAHHLELMRLHMAALQSFQPGPYSGKVTLFSASGRTVNQVLFGSVDSTHGWGALAAGGVDVRKVAGGHRNIHVQPYVPSLADELREAIELSG